MRDNTVEEAEALLNEIETERSTRNRSHLTQYTMEEDGGLSRAGETTTQAATTMQPFPIANPTRTATTFAAAADNKTAATSALET